MADTLIGVFFEAVARRGGGTMFKRRRAGGWESIAAERALADVESLGLALAELGVAPGDRVALLSESRYEWAVTDLAVLGLGAVLAPLYPTLPAEKCRATIDGTAARVLVLSTDAQLAKARAVLPSLSTIQAVVVMDELPVDRPRERTLAELQRRGVELRARDPLAFRDRAAAARRDDVATIIFTSGTTGESKGVVLTHANILSNVDACLEVVGLGPRDTCLSFLPLCHIFERMAGLHAMVRAGATIAYAHSFDTVRDDLVDVKPTIITTVPRFLERARERALESVASRSRFARRLFQWGLAQGRRGARAHFQGREVNDLPIRLADVLVARKVRQRMGGRLRACISGGAPLDPEVMEFFFAMGITVLEGYGLTETSPVIALNPPSRERPGSVGKPIPGVEVRIGDEGEILVRGPSVMRGYYQDEAGTRTALRDGWFHTGDVGRFDGDGYLYITDRLKDLLVLAGGRKVAPQPIEAKLRKSPLISEVMLIGDRRPYVACLVAPNFTTLEAKATEHGWTWRTRAELVALPQVRSLFESEIAAVNATLEKVETVKRFTLLDHELTHEDGALTMTLRVRRRVVNERYAELIEALYRDHGVARTA